MKQFETERLKLKIANVMDTPKILDYFKRNHEFLGPWSPVRPHDFYTLEYHIKNVKGDLYTYNEGRGFRYWISPKDNPNIFIGTVSFSNIVMGAFKSCFLGYSLDKDYINKGMMTEAIGGGIDVMFNHYGLHRIEANIIPRNEASLSVVRKLGFYDEGLAIKYLNINGVWEDHIHMVIRNEALE